MLKIFLFIISISTFLLANMEGDIVFIQGDSSYKESNAQKWQNAKLKQSLFTGDSLQTKVKSQLGILFKDRTQIRMGENTFLTIKDSTKQKNTLLMKFGKIFSQANNPSKSLNIQTPSVTASIRGTKWLLVVDEKATKIIVKEGVVLLKNEFGFLNVLANQSAIAQKGKAPVILSIAKDESRVNWVNQHVIDPLRHIRKYLKETKECKKSVSLECKWLNSYVETSELIFSGNIDKAQRALEKRLKSTSKVRAADLKLSADIQIYSGDFKAARTLYEKGVALYPKDQDFLTLGASLYIIEGKLHEAQSLFNSFIHSPYVSEYGYGSYGYLKELQGDAKAAKTYYEKAIQRNPNYDKAWLHLGQYHLQRSDMTQAKENLLHSQTLNPSNQETLGSLAQLESETNNFKKAQSYFKEALKGNKQDYVTLSALGFSQLKRGENAKALNTLLQAELIEPNYSPTHQHLAVAYYRLHKSDLALRSLKHASEVDPKNPLPFHIKSIILSDLNRYYEAVIAAKKSKELLPYLKSMNKILSDSKGSASLGQAFSKFGMYETTLHYANESYLPLWSGSHFLMADRLSGAYQKNSELTQGLLLDSLSFGASNQLQTIYDSPGTYGSLSGSGGLFESDSVRFYGYSASVNGLFNSFIPISYFAEITSSDFKFDLGDVGEFSNFKNHDEATSFTLATGIKPLYNLNVFLYYQYQLRKGEVSYITPALFYDYYEPDMKYNRVTLGANYAFSPFSKLSAKSGLFSSTNDGKYSVQEYVDPSGTTLLDTKDNHSNALYDLSLLYAYQLNDKTTLSLGSVQSIHEENNMIKHTYQLSGFNFISEDSYKSDESDLHIFATYKYKNSNEFEIDSGVWYSTLNKEATYSMEYDSTFEPNPPLNEKMDYKEFLPRVGSKYAINSNLLLRGAIQHWRKPLAYSSLEPILTAGIPLDVNYVKEGGKLQRYKLQLEYEKGTSFFTLFGDYQEVDNEIFSFNAGMFIGDEEYLDRLQNSDVFSQNFASNDIIESDVSAIQSFRNGDVSTFGISVNQILSREWSAFVRYNHFETQNREIGFEDNVLPGFPKYAVSSGVAWLLPWGLSSYSKLTYRDKRYFDNANKDLKKSSLDLDFSLTYESPMKDFHIKLGAFDILDSNKDSWVGTNVGVKF